MTDAEREDAIERQKLRPCPVCGSEASVECHTRGRRGMSWRGAAFCLNGRCGIRTPILNSPKKCASRWNGYAKAQGQSHE